MPEGINNSELSSIMPVIMKNLVWNLIPGLHCICPLAAFCNSNCLSVCPLVTASELDNKTSQMNF